MSVFFLLSITEVVEKSEKKNGKKTKNEYSKKMLTTAAKNVHGSGL
jgi:hypothetical protein